MILSAVNSHVQQQGGIANVLSRLLANNGANPADLGGPALAGARR
ncbi:hypothetical protein BLL52_2595 [Rhodoferax antarcticus ANT.BR]|uniref:Uncharacterized protein n=1 Tax=Rhodoferax antarcticus ANT.BR TaxID=1111071 RepID=A0A1Q8YE63_9BURK|nr:hypothetical protein BLL52_2595 [Rhodoferax antarcticus ANT.BR]